MAASQSDPFDFGEPVYRITRAQLIGDGVLFDLTGEYPAQCQRAGLAVHAAMTATLYSLAVWPIEAPEGAPAGTFPDGETERAAALTQAGESFDRRVVRLLSAYRHTLNRVQRRLTRPEFVFAVTVQHAPGDWREVDVKAHAGPGDNGEPVLTFLLPNED